MTARVLIVEDESIVALHLKLQLEKLGYTVTAVADNGALALERMGREPAELVLMDININGPMDGVETARRIKDVPVIYLTAFSEEATLARARTTRPFGFLIKPFSERELHATIQMALKRHEVELALRASQERLGLALSAAELGLWEIDVTGRHMLYSTEARALFEGEDGPVIRALDEFALLVDERDRPGVTGAIRRLLASGGQTEIEFRTARLENGAPRWLKARGRAFPPASGMGSSPRIVGVVQDVTARRANEERLRQTATAFGVMQDAIAMLDPSFTVTTVNENCARLTGYGTGDFVARSFFRLPLAAALPEGEIRAALAEEGHWRAEVETMRRSGEIMRTLMHIAAVADDDDTVTHYVAVLSDMTSVRRAEAELAHLAHYDALTGLPNRLLAIDRLSQSLRRVRREKERLGVLFIDLDRFKPVNDMLGHSVGDALLAETARRVKGVVRKSDTVARLGGDEFIVVLDEMDEPVDAAQVAQKLLETLSLPFTIAGNELFLSASIGISLYPGNGGDAQALVSAADTAMYSAKQAGRNRYAFYAAEMTASTLVTINQERELRQALRQGELRLFYQPQICLRSGRVNGVEALIRWQHPRRGLLGAGDVVPAAEKLGIIADIGDWVIEEACRQIAAWRRDGIGDVRIAVNVSAAQLQDGRVIDCVKGALDATCIDPALLELEVTESMVQDEEACFATLTALAALGTTLALDDFGTGYSCLKSLLRLPIHRVKLDRTFTSGLPADPRVCAIASTIIAMSHQLGMYVLAEGVETPEQEAYLRSLDCEESQGFLHARPMPVAEAAACIARAGLNDGRGRLTPSGDGTTKPLPSA
jgi:diguanylate cyclase (GGDEF)-like protein/PAS domain S-box-containing protein